MKFPGFIGAAYKLDAVDVDAQRCVNLYPETIESGIGKGAQVAYLTTTPGLELLCEVGDGPLRCVHVDNVGRVFVVSGNKLYTVTYTGGVFTATEVGDGTKTFETSEGPVQAKSSSPVSDGINSRCDTAFVDGKNYYAFIDFGELGYPDFGTFDNHSISTPGEDIASTQIEWVDGFYIVNQISAINGEKTQTFSCSDRGSFNFDSLSFDSAEGNPDVVMAIAVNHRDVWIFNEQSIEVFAWSGNADFPFDRVQGGFLEVGCAAEYSVAKIDGTLFWLGRGNDGMGQVFAAKGTHPQRISTHAIERAIAKYDNISNATAYTYESLGHKFYVLNFDEATWTYDLSTNLWHERGFTNAGLLERHRAQYHAFFPGTHRATYGLYPPLEYDKPLHLVTDYATNKLYALKNDVFTDNGDAITRLRVTPYVSGTGKRYFCSSFQLDMETGVGLDGDVQGSDPLVMLDWSNDGGRTWSNELFASAGKSIGAIGEFTKRVIWRRLGSFRSRIFRVRITDPVKVNLIDAFFEVEGGES